MNYCAEVEGMPLSVVFAGDFEEEMIFIIRKLESSAICNQLGQDESLMR